MITRRMLPFMHQDGQPGGAPEGAPAEGCSPEACASCGADCPSKGGGIQKAQLNVNSSVKR